MTLGPMVFQRNFSGRGESSCCVRRRRRTAVRIESPRAKPHPDQCVHVGVGRGAEGRVPESWGGGPLGDFGFILTQFPFLGPMFRHKPTLFLTSIVTKVNKRCF